MEHKLLQLKRVSEIHSIVVSSEDDEILSIAQKYDVITMKRPDKYADSECVFGEFVEYICNCVNGDDILWACCTSPFVDEVLYSQSLKLYAQKLQEGYDSMISVQKLNRFIIDQNGPVNYQKGMRHKRAEQLNDLMVFTNGIVIAPRKKMIEWKYIWGNIPYMVEVDRKTGIDISDKYDYEWAKFLLEKMGD